jgi:hypothetical protein
MDGSSWMLLPVMTLGIQNIHQDFAPEAGWWCMPMLQVVDPFA